MLEAEEGRKLRMGKEDLSDDQESVVLRSRRCLVCSTDSVVE